MPVARERYAPCLAASTSLDDFDIALGAVMSDRLAGRVTSGQGVALEEDIRRQREEFAMRHGG